MAKRDKIYDEVAPNPSSMIESMRSTGYSLPTAIADLIDNSIAARARNIWIQFAWDDTEPWVRIADDGHGMSEADLRDAMRLGSRSPLEARDKQDLGRFGLGLKTASLSQCRRLTVASTPPRGVQHIRRWDLDYLARPSVTGWHLLRSVADGSEDRIRLENGSSQGTVVLWENVDRFKAPQEVDRKIARDHFYREIERVEIHLAMVFHRYLATPRSSLKIFLNETRIKPWDPFLEDHPATQVFPVDPIRLPGRAGVVHVKGFVLPHKDHLGDKDHAAASGPAGWNAQQGFYVYRNERLIVPGDWLGLGKGRPWMKEEHYKLARIKVDITNAMDHMWQLDVKKSSASPPPIIRDRLYNLAAKVRETARQVYAHRGRYGHRTKRQELLRPWKATRRSGTVCYHIDRQHPVIANLLKQVDPAFRESLDAVLGILEETVPVQQIWLDAAEHPDGHPAPFETTAETRLRRIIEQAFRLLRHNGRLSRQEAVETLLSLEEFGDDRATAIIQTLQTQE